METPSKTPNRPERAPLSTLVNRLARAVTELPPGDIAALRRMRPDEADCPAFWRLVVSYLEPAGALRGNPDDAERRWAALLAMMAEMAGQHAPRRRLGEAMGEAGVSEHRVLRLLRAHGSALEDELRLLGHFLGSKAEPVDFTDVAHLVLTDRRAGEETARRNIARHYYRTAAHT